MRKQQLIETSSCKALIVCAFAVWALAGCANSPVGSRPSETIIDRVGVDIVAADSTRQLTYLKERGSTERFCRGPGADAINTASDGVAVQLPLSVNSVGLGEQRTTGAVDLGGRNPLVLIAREFMYRACELASNSNADGGTERQIYLQFLQAVVSISKVQMGTGVAALASEPAPLVVLPPPLPAPPALALPPSALAPAPPASAGPTPTPDVTNPVPGT